MFIVYKKNYDNFFLQHFLWLMFLHYFNSNELYKKLNIIHLNHIYPSLFWLIWLEFRSFFFFSFFSDLESAIKKCFCKIYWSINIHKRCSYSYLFWLVALCKLFFGFSKKGNEISQLDCAANCYGLHILGFQGKNDPSAKKNFTSLGEFAFFFGNTANKLWISWWI